MHQGEFIKAYLVILVTASLRWVCSGGFISMAKDEE